MGSIFSKLLGDPNKRKLKRYDAIITSVNNHAETIAKLSDDELRLKTGTFKEQLANGATLDDILPEAFAVVREVSTRILGLRPFDVQILGGAVLHAGNISEMRTGEGKTLTATMPAYLNALTGRQVHIVTVNDYLAFRDAQTMRPLYEALGMTTSAIVSGMSDLDKKEAYKADIAYATNNELGFDYLRDNGKNSLEDIHQKDHYFAIVDEVDSILIDEARTPLIISGPTPDRSELYITVNKMIPSLSEDHFEIDEKTRSATLTEDGMEFVERYLKDAELVEPNGTLYDPENTTLVHHVNQALIAHKIYQADRHYLMKNGKVMLVDEFTGRVMEGRRLSSGLHQAIEAKEGVQIYPESITLASVTYQNYFRLYEKLAGMTGTAMTEADEFLEIYKLDSIEIPTNLPIERIDEEDRIYRNQSSKTKAITAEVKEAHAKGQPILIGTTSIDKSENLSRELTAAGIKHNVLNARHHEKEAEIIANAGLPGAVTIATNMAGRGTDIQLGGNIDAEVSKAILEAGENANPAEIREAMKAKIADAKDKALAAGGLFVIGTERHESRRIDNQLRGRSGRQGDPGRTLFFLALDDDLMRIFGGERMEKMVNAMGLDDEEAMEHKMLSRALERSQRKVEGRNFDIRKNLLRFDDIMNEQRKVIFHQRKEILEADDMTEITKEMRDEVIEDLIMKAIPEGTYTEEWDVEKIIATIRENLAIDVPLQQWIDAGEFDENDLIDRLQENGDMMMKDKRAKYGEEAWNSAEKEVILGTIDKNWQEHLESLDHLRSVISFRAHAQRDPYIEYKTESFEMFEALLARVREEAIKQLGFGQLVSQEEREAQKRAQLEAILKDKNQPANVHAQVKAILEGMAQGLTADQAAAIVTQEAARQAQNSNFTPRKQPKAEPVDYEGADNWAKTARNELCPCGSGKKYKHCHGAL